MSGSDRPPRKGRAGRIAALAAFIGLLGCAVILFQNARSTPDAHQTDPGPSSIPGPEFAPGWAKAGQLRTFVGQDLFNQIDGGAELFLELGFAKLRLQAYARGKAELTLNTYEMESAESALGVYLMKMGRETPFPEIAARNSSEEVQLTILKGRYFVQVDNLGEVPASKAEAMALANAFLAGVAEESAPTTLDALPAEGKLPGSERLVRGPYGLQPFFTFGEGDILSLGGRIFGALAEYRMPDGSAFHRLIVPYPTPEAAEAALAHLKANLDPYLKVTADRPDGLDFVDFQSRQGAVVRSGAVLDIRFNCSHERAGLVAMALSPGSPPSPPPDVPTIPHLPLVYEVLFPPTPVKAEGSVRLIYELQMTNMFKGPLSLCGVEILGDGKTIVGTYQGDRLSDCLVRPGQSQSMKDRSVMEGGTRAVLFIMLTFGKDQAVPDFLTHRITAEYVRTSGEKRLARGVGAQVPVRRTPPPQIAPPVRPGVWLSGNGAGDGPVGHRLSLQAWNGRLVVNERYALDFMKFGDDGRLVRGDSSSNSHWSGYGQEVIAVADGVVCAIKDGVIENTPGAGYAVANSLDEAAGNYVILGIGPEIYAVYAHLQPKSLRVKAGDKIGKGQVLGLIGNSGISDAPHLHFHLIDTGSVFGGESIPFVFERFELMETFENIDGSLDRSWAPKGESSPRSGEMPLGDVVLRFPRY